jgi:hypothetical protein
MLFAVSELLGFTRWLLVSSNGRQYLKEALMPEQVKSPEGEYSVIRRGEDLPEGFKQNYWMRVKRALKEIIW